MSSSRLSRCHRPDRQKDLTFRKGKELLRNPSGQAGGVADARFADVAWGHAALEQMR